jgi:hypothetical protein
MADESVVCETPVLNSLRPKIGARFVREHAGKLHEVTALVGGSEGLGVDDGFGGLELLSATAAIHR